MFSSAANPHRGASQHPALTSVVAVSVPVVEAVVVATEVVEDSMVEAAFMVEAEGTKHD
jgi:ABC-type proline/glycine betaine transport system permease subunit